MKIKTKSLVVALLGLVMAIAMVFGVLTFGDHAVLADGAPTLSMVSGASARKAEDTPGIRFTAKIDNYSSHYTYGMLILPEVAWTNGVFDENTNYHEYFATHGITNYADVVCEHTYHDEQGQWYMSASLVGITSATRSLVGVAYTLKDGVYTYTPVNLAENARSIAYVAQMALKYDLSLTTAQRNNLKTYANAVVIEEDDLLTGDSFAVNGSVNSESADIALKYTPNANKSEQECITKNSYAGASTISFKYFIPSGTTTTWWGIAWHTNASSADIYHAAGVNDPVGYEALGFVKGVWVDYKLTLPSGGPYYLYFGAAVGGWSFADGTDSYILIDDFTVNGEVEDFNDGIKNSIFKQIGATVDHAVKGVTIEFGDASETSEYSMKYLFNVTGETVSQVTKNSYASGTTVSFKYYLPKEINNPKDANKTSSWWGLVCSTVNTGLDIYKAASDANGYCLEAGTSIVGEWTTVNYTIPDGGPYYLYFGSAVNEWEMTDGSQPYVLIDDFTVNGDVEGFDGGVEDCIFTILEPEGITNGEGYVPLVDTMLAFEYSAIGGYERIGMITNTNYKNVSEITFRAKWVHEGYANTADTRWGLSYTTDPTTLNAYSFSFGNLKLDVGVWYDYRIEIDMSGKTYEVYANDELIGSGTHTLTSRVSAYFYFGLNPKSNLDSGTAFYMSDFSITYGTTTVVDNFNNSSSTVFVDSILKNTDLGSNGIGFVAESIDEDVEEPELEKVGDLALKIMLNNGNDGVRAITKNAYAGGSTVSFRYFIQADQAVQWTRFIWDTDTTTDNYASTYVSFGNAQGEWTKWEYTLPEGGPYYLYLGFECGNWADSSGAPYVLIDDFTVNGEIETFDYGAENCSFAILQSNLASIGEGGYIAPPPQALGAKLTIDLISSTKTTPSFITKQAYTLTEDTTITFDYFMSGNTNSKWWTFNWTSNNKDASIYAFVETSAVAFGTELNRVQDVWTSASVTVPAGTWYFYFAGAVGEWSGGYVIIDNFQVGDVVSENFNNGTDYGIFADNRDSKPDAITLANGKSDFVPGEYSVELDFTNSFENNASTFISKKAYAGGSVISFKYMIPNETTVGDWWSFNWTTNLASPDFWAVGNGAAEGCGGVNPNPNKNKGQGWVEYTVTLPAGGPYYLYFCGYSNWNGCVYIDDFTIWSTDGIFTDDFTNGANGNLFTVGNSDYVSVGDGYIKEIPEEKDRSAKISVNDLTGAAKGEFITKQAFEAGSVVTFDYFIPSGVTFKTNGTWWALCTTTNPLTGADIYSNHKVTLPKVQGEWQTVTYTLESAGHVYFGAAIGEWQGDACFYIDNFTVTKGGDEIVNETFSFGLENSVFAVTSADAVSLVSPPGKERQFTPEEFGYLVSGIGANYVASGGSVDYENMPNSMLIVSGSIKYEMTGNYEFAISLGNGYFLYVRDTEVSFYQSNACLRKIVVKNNSSINIAITADGKVSVRVADGSFIAMGLMDAQVELFNIIALGGEGSVKFDEITVHSYSANTAELSDVPLYVSGEAIDFTAYAFDSYNMVSDAGYELLADAGFTKTLALLQGRVSRLYGMADYTDSTYKNGGYADMEINDAEVERLMKQVNADALKALDLAEKYGMQHYVFNEALYNLERHTKWYDHLEYMAQLAKYTTHSAFAGHFLGDEPSSGELTEMATAYAKYKQYFTNGDGFVNLLSNTATLLSNESTYKNYIEKYRSGIASATNGSGFISYDMYPLKYSSILGYTSTSIESKHLWNLEHVAGVCRDNGLEFRTYIKASETGDSERTLRGIDTVNDLYIQIYSALCYGAKEIIYYQFTDQNAVEGSAGDGVINGVTLDTTAPVYQFAKQTNNEIHAFDAAYNNFNWVSASVFGSTSYTQFNNLDNKANAYGYISSVSSSAHVLVGNFANKNTGNRTYGDLYAYMVQNYGDTGSSQAESSIAITFNGTPTRALVYENGVARVVTLTNNVLTLNLELGEGAFVIPLI